MKPVMASLRTEFGDAVAYRYHEYNAPDSAQVVRDFQIVRHPEIFILDRQGNLVRKFAGVVPTVELQMTLRGLLR
jgi:hypothetical protein